MSLATDRPLYLVADDIPIAAAMACRLIVEAGAAVLGPAVDGREALRLFEQARPDGAVLDVQMPHLTGIEVVRAIRAAGRPCLVIVATSSGEPEIRKEALAAGADHFLIKGVDFDRLSEIVSAHVASRRAG